MTAIIVTEKREEEGQRTGGRRCSSTRAREAAEEPHPRAGRDEPRGECGQDWGVRPPQEGPRGPGPSLAHPGSAGRADGASSQHLLSLAGFTVRTQHATHTHDTSTWLFALSVRRPTNGRLLAVKILGTPRLYADFSNNLSVEAEKEFDKIQHPFMIKTATTNEPKHTALTKLGRGTSSTS